MGNNINAKYGNGISISTVQPLKLLCINVNGTRKYNVKWEANKEKNYSGSHFNQVKIQWKKPESQPLKNADSGNLQLIIQSGIFSLIFYRFSKNSSIIKHYSHNQKNNKKKRKNNYHSTPFYTTQILVIPFYSPQFLGR